MQGTFHSVGSATATPAAAAASIIRGSPGSRRGEALLARHFGVDRREEEDGTPLPQYGNLHPETLLPHTTPLPFAHEETVVTQYQRTDDERVPLSDERVLRDQEQEAMLRARETDMQYARMVAGGMHVRSLSAVWGPRDGVGMNMVDTKRMQDELYQYIVDKVDDKIREDRATEEAAAAATTQPSDDDVETVLVGTNSRFFGVDAAPPPVNGPNQAAAPGAPANQIRNLANIARIARNDFNDGWQNLGDVGVLNETVSAEIQVVLMLRQNGGIAAWDGLLTHSRDPMMRVRLLRRFGPISATFATTVGAVVTNNVQTKPTVRPTRAVLERAAIDTAMQFQAMMREVMAVRFKLQVCPCSLPD